MPHVCFVLHPKFQLLAYVVASETLRVANKQAGRTRFTWEARTATGHPVEASNGQIVAPDVRGWADSVPPDLVLLLAGYDPLAIRPNGLRDFLKRSERHGAILGGIDTGAAILASFGMLGESDVVVHHEAEPWFRETWPDIVLSDGIFAFDGARMSSAGGTATGDLILEWIARIAGTGFADDVADALVHGSLRPSAQSQKPRETADPMLQAMRTMMLGHLETPLAIPVIATRLGLSEKRLRTICKAVLKRTPADYYLWLRLQHARALLTSTRMPVTEVAIATGFGSHAGFSRTYRQVFGEKPKDSRLAEQKTR